MDIFPRKNVHKNRKDRDMNREKIKASIKTLRLVKITPTQKIVSAACGVSIKTVSRCWKEVILEVDLELKNDIKTL